MSDPQRRIEVMSEFGIDMQVLLTPNPPLDEVFDAGTAADLAALANDVVAGVVDAMPNRFLGIATVSLQDVRRTMAEIERAVKQLGLRGVLVYSSMRGRPLDRPELDEFYAVLEELSVPMWLHRHRADHADYPDERTSKYRSFLVFGWPYETTLAMARLVLGGVMERHPELKVLAHHAGAMVPRLSGRMAHDYLAPHSDSSDLSRPVMDYCRDFYVDTITQGSPGALMSAIETFGKDRVLFASDMPFGRDEGRSFVSLEVETLASLPVTPRQKDKIWCDNLGALVGGLGAGGLDRPREA